MRSLLVLFLFFVACLAISKRSTDECSAKCVGGRMTMTCCECIGCHQGMRFGKRAEAPMFYDMPQEPVIQLYEIDDNSYMLPIVRQQRSPRYIFY
ncbi:unnamed protein product, partial [Mesorhabditis spiculigera]